VPIPPSSSWKTGDYLTHRFNPELGIGRITATEGRTLLVEFPRSGAMLTLARTTDALLPVELIRGRPVRLIESGEQSTIDEPLSDGTLRLANGRIVRAHELWPLHFERSLLERLAIGDLDDGRDLLVRLKNLQFLSTRQAGGLGSFLGGRVRLFPHQLHVAERATSADPVRWLLADEVGLGKTIEACLILNRLVHSGKVERCVVVAPQSLTVQWLGELWRKYHQVFTLLDSDRLADVARDFGPDFNPFDVHRRVVIALELLVERPQLTTQAVAAGIDLLVVDEAQRLKRPPRHPGAPAWRAVAPIAGLGRHVLLLSATPLEDDAHGFFRLLQLLRPEEFPEDDDFESRMARGIPLPPCTSSTRRVDIGGLPQRVGIAIDTGEEASARSEVERTVRTVPGGGVRLQADFPGRGVRLQADLLARRHTIDRMQRLLSSGAALAAVLGPEEVALRQHALSMDANDARLQWLVSKAPAWRAAGEKTLVFVAHHETLEVVRDALSQRTQLASGLFHEGLSVVRRDTEVARFREADGPSLLVSTESGGEGRNFEFCRRLILFDLPWKPTVVEQRIGRLDRIGRRDAVEIVYFRRRAGIDADVVRLYEALGLFREPLAGLEPQLAHIEGAIAEIAVDPAATMTDGLLEQLIADARAARTRIQEAAYQQLHRDPYRAEMAEQILARVPADLDALVQSAVLDASTRLGFKIDRLKGRRKFAIDFGNEAVVDSLPGVPGGATFVGTFDREEAVQDELIDFFASGHPLVEGLLAHVEDSPDGRVGLLEISIGQEAGEGVALIYKDGARVEVVVFDSVGRPRPEWAAAFHQRPLPARPVRADQSGGHVDWAALVSRMQGQLDSAREPHAVAGIVVRPVDRRAH
jgi:ATP-dependent helicase HepA